MGQANILTIVTAMLILIITAGVALFGLTGLSIIQNTPSCVFSDTQHDCTLNITIPAGEQAAYFDANITGVQVPSAYFTQWQTLNSKEIKTLITIQNGATYNYRNDYLLYLYTMPGEDISQVQVQAEFKGNATCNYENDKYSSYSDNGQIFGYINFQTIDNGVNTLNVGSFGSYNRAYIEANYLIATESVSDGTTINFLSQEINNYAIASCYGKHSNVGSIIKNATYTLKDPQENIRIISGYDKFKQGGNPTLSTSAPIIKARFRYMIYPQNLVLTVGNTQIQAWQGKFNNTVRSLDFSDQINAYCKNTQGACTIPINLHSDTQGALYVHFDSNNKLKVSAQQNAPQIILVQNNTPLQNFWQHIIGFFKRIFGGNNK